MTRTRWLSSSQEAIYVLSHTVLVFAGLALTAKGGVLSVSLGTALIATGVAGYVLFLYVGYEQARKRQLEVLERFGFTDGFEGRAAAIRKEYDDRVAKARQGIDILGFGLRQLREDYSDQFPAWAARCPVRILLIDPDFPTADASYALQRDREERVTPETIRGEVNSFLRATAALRRNAAHQGFEVKLYRCLPSINIFRVDDDLFWGPYLVHQYSRNTPTFIVRKGGIMYTKLEEHFNRIWDDPSLSVKAPEDEP